MTTSSLDPDPDAAPPTLVFGQVNSALNAHWADHERSVGARPTRTVLSPDAFECLATQGGAPRSIKVFEGVISRGNTGETVVLAVDFALGDGEFRSESDERLVDA